MSADIVQIFPQNNNMFYFFVASVQDPERLHLLVRHFHDLRFRMSGSVPEQSQIVHYTHRAERDLFCKVHMSPFKHGDLHAPASDIQDRAPFFCDLRKIIHNGDRPVTQIFLLGIAQDPDVKSGPYFYLIQYKDLISRVPQSASRIYAAFVASICLADLLQIIQTFAQLVHGFIINRRIFVQFRSQIQTAPDIFHIPDLPFGDQFLYLKINFI